MAAVQEWNWSSGFVRSRLARISARRHLFNQRKQKWCLETLGIKLWAMENPPLIEFPSKPACWWGFPIDMFDCRRVNLGESWQGNMTINPYSFCFSQTFFLGNLQGKAPLVISFFFSPLTIVTIVASCYILHKPKFSPSHKWTQLLFNPAGGCGAGTMLGTSLAIGNHRFTGKQ